MSDGPSTVELLVRLVFSLGIIIGILVVAARMARKSGGFLRLAGLKPGDSSITVLDRQALSKSASLAVVRVGTRTMVVGITDQGISLLADAPELSTEPSIDITGANPARGAVTELDVRYEGDTAPPTNRITGMFAGVARSATPSREAKWTLPLGPSTAGDSADTTRPPRMSFVEALRELTVRKT
jgi:flagellar protein FliO/FliZ